MTDKDEIKGKAKEGFGKLTGDNLKELEGKVQNKFGEAKDAIKEKADDIAEKINHKTEE